MSYENEKDKIELTVDEIQKIMDRQVKKTFNAEAGLEWEGSIQSAPVEYTEKRN